jgi:hypothetical protein
MGPPSCAPGRGSAYPAPTGPLCGLGTCSPPRSAVPSCRAVAVDAVFPRTHPPQSGFGKRQPVVPLPETSRQMCSTWVVGSADVRAMIACACLVGASGASVGCGSGNHPLGLGTMDASGGTSTGGTIGGSPPGAFGLLTPSDGDRVSTTPTLTWEKSTEATSYTVRIGMNRNNLSLRTYFSRPDARHAIIPQAKWSIAT